MDSRQGRQLIALLKRGPMTTRDLLFTGISVSPWKRISECLREDESLIKTKNARGLLVYRVFAKGA